jgi:hypothetical protein
MDDLKAGFSKLGIGIPEVYLPAPGVDYSRWAVVACDQYSSERNYWEQVSRYVGRSPSTFNLIYPEAYLEEPDKAERIGGIQASMRDYLARKVIENKGPGFVLVERHSAFSDKPRVGLIVAVDLERYEYKRGSTSLIRPTEGTIVERLPPRMQIRRGAPLELPHIMLLLDDPARSVIEPLYSGRAKLPALYDFDLMQGAGHLRGWHVSDPEVLGAVRRALERLADPLAFERKHSSADVLLFAVGDGNHSLATAKAIWEETKAGLAPGDPLLESHPARYALVELVNIYDEGLPFHPIHRLLFNVKPTEFVSALRTANPKGSPARANVRMQVCHDPASAFAAVNERVEDAHRIGFTSERSSGYLEFLKPAAHLATETIQTFLDSFLASHPGAGIDYIHGDESLVSLASRPGNLGLYLPPVDKASFFGDIIRDGVMPRKTFSMGEAPEKRFYVEARRIMN